MARITGRFGAATLLLGMAALSAPAEARLGPAEDGTATLAPGGALDLDTGRLGAGRGADVALIRDKNGRAALTPKSGAYLALIGARRPSLRDCLEAQYGVAPAPLPPLIDETHFCARTDQGRAVALALSPSASGGGAAAVAYSVFAPRLGTVEQPHPKARTAAAARREAAAKGAFPARLVGHAILPAETLIAPPADAPSALRVSGKFAGPNAPSRSRARPTDGAATPLRGQPIQGFSAVAPLGEGLYYALSDNGFGNKMNSSDAMLAFHALTIHFEAGTAAVERTVFLSDPDKILPFPIAMEGTERRYLTGSDLDPESFAILGDEIVIGEEFGPFLIVADLETGIVRSLHETQLGEAMIRSPDNFQLRAGNPDAPETGATLARSRGFEGLTARPDGARLLGMLEGPLWDRERRAYEQVDGVEALRILEWDAPRRAWTGRSWLYPLEATGNLTGDFTLIDETRALVIERDNGQGDAERACAAGQTKGCFRRPAAFKRVYLIDFEGVPDGAPVQKLGYVDLLDIEDPDARARQGRREDGRFTFPFITIENLALLDETRILVGNDNNFPFTKGRDPERVDDSEWILLDVGELLAAGRGE